MKRHAEPTRFGVLLPADDWRIVTANFRVSSTVWCRAVEVLHNKRVLCKRGDTMVGSGRCNVHGEAKAFRCREC